MGDPLATSFLDVLSNGLGAGILLMVLIAAIPIERPAASVPDGPFVRASWIVGGDPSAVLYLRILPPGAARPFLVDTGSLPDDAVLDLKCHWSGVTPAGSAQLYGFTLGGTAAATGERDDGSRDRAFVFWISEPVPGDWQIGVVYANRADSGLTKPEPISVVPTIEKRGAGPQVMPAVELALGEVHMDQFTIDNYSFDTTGTPGSPCTNWF